MRFFSRSTRLLPVLGTALFVQGAFITTARGADEVVMDFEDAKTADFSELRGKNSEGSNLEVSTEKAHGGKQSLKLAYKSGGYIEFNSQNALPFAHLGDKLPISLWVFGAGKNDFADASIRLLDANGETFQFRVPGLAEALAGDGWRQVKSNIDSSKPGGHWGDNSDGVLNKPLRFLGFAAGRNSETVASGTIYLDDIRLGEAPDPNSPVPPPENLTVTPLLPTAKGPAAAMLKWVSAPGKPIVFRAVLPADSKGASIVWKVRDAFDIVVGEGQTVVPANAAPTVEFRLEKPPRGVLYATASLRNAKEEVVAEAKTRVAVFEPNEKPVPLNPFIWGVAAHLGREQGKNADAEIALMRMIGFASSRSDMTWSTIQPTADAWNWATADKIYASLEKEKILPVPVLAYGTKWATTGDANSPDWHQWNNTPPRDDAFAAYAAAAVKRYGHLTRYWEIWNEPDIDFWLGTVEQYASLVDATVPAIKAVQPNAQVMNGGFSETKRRPNFIPEYLKVTKQQPDIFAVHTHGSFDNMLRAETTVQSYLDGAGLTGPKRPGVWLNEAGYSNVRSTEGEQAIQLVKKMAYAPAAGYMGYTWYDLRDDGTDPNENEHNFGLVKNDFAPKASMVAANTLLNTIGGRQFTGRLNVGKGGYALAYQGLGKSVLAAWRQSYTKGDAVVPLVVRAKSANGAAIKLAQSDIFGNTTPLPVKDGLFFLPMRNVPQYIVADGENIQFELARGNGMLIDFPPSIVAVPGEKLAIPVKMTNPFAVPLKASLTVAGSPDKAVDVAPNSAREYTVTVNPKGKAGSRETVALKLVSAQIPSELTALVEVQSAFAIPAGPENLEVKLPRTSVVSLFEATPMVNLHIKDEADLGATLQLQKTTAGTKAKIVVTDQTHNIDAAPGQWWRGDSLQWAISLPGGEMCEWMATLLPTGPEMIINISPDGKLEKNHLSRSVVREIRPPTSGLFQQPCRAVNRFPNASI